MNLASETRWEDLWGDLWMVMPEVWLVVAMCAVVLAPFIKRRSVALPLGVASAGLMLAVMAALSSFASADAMGTVFTGSLVIDPFSQFFKVLLTLFTLMILGLWILHSRSQTDPADAPDFLCLLLGAAVGMSLMVSATNLLVIFIATETASMPSYALAGFRKRRREGSEGSLKYVLFGSVSSAIMLYGMSLVYGAAGTLSIYGIAAQAAAGISPLMAIGLAAMLAGFAFKLSAVPMHFWCPDVFQGAPIEVTTFLSVASKGAAMCMLLRALAAFAAAAPANGYLFVGIGVAVGILGAVTATWGNLVALHQTNIKRLLAYSSISHAGYMLMAASVAVIAGRSWEGGQHQTGAIQVVVGAVLFYIVVYAFMNLGAFTAATLLAMHTGTEDIRGYAGLSRRSPWLAALMTACLLSLFGMPGLGGFWGKVFLMKSMALAGGAGFALIAVLLFNTLISLYYYLKPVYYMYFVPDEDERPAFLPAGGGLAMLVICVSVLLATGLLPNRIESLARGYATLYPNPVITAPPPLETTVSLLESAPAHD